MTFAKGRFAEWRLFHKGDVERPYRPWTPKINGHPSFSPNGKWLLNDSYPDRYGEQTLEVYRVDDGARLGLGRFGICPSLRGEIRCDLHPRWSPDGNWVFFDSTHEGRRAVYRLGFSGQV